MEFNRTKNSARTFIFGLFSKSITIIGPFITRTIVIYKMGSEYVGLSGLFTSILTILSVTELGIGNAITFCLYKPIADDNKDQIKALLFLLKKLYRIIGAVILFVGVLLIPLLPNIIKGDYPQNINIYLLYLIYLINSCASYFGFEYKKVLFNANQRGDIIHKIDAIIEVIKYAIQITVLLLFSNYYIYIAVLPLSTISATLATQIISKKTYPEIIPEGDVDKETKNLIKQKAYYLSAHSVAATLTNSVDAIVISGSIGLIAVSIYGNYNLIQSSIFSLLLIGYRALIPVVGNSLIMKSKEENIEIYNSLYFMFFWIIAFCCASLLSLYQPFMTFWVGKERLIEFSAVVMIVFYFYSNATRQFIDIYVSAVGLWNKTLKRQIVAAVVNLILDLLLAKKYGIGGIVFASFFVNSIIALPMDIYVTYRYVFNKKSIEGLKKILISFVLTVIICSITYYFCSLIMVESKIAFLLKALICLCVPNSIIYFASFKKREFKYLREHIIGTLLNNNHD